MFVVFQSCEKKGFFDAENKMVNKENVNADINRQQLETFEYYIDDKQINKNEFDKYTDKYEEPFIIYTGKKDEKTGEIMYLVYAYTTEAKYIAYGKKII